MGNPFRRINGRQWYAPDYGHVVKRRDGYWAANDCRTELIGVRSDELCMPVVGPCKTLKEAIRRYGEEMTKIRNGKGGEG